MRDFCIFAFAAIFLAFVTSASAQPVGSRHMAFCTDGDGALSDWVDSREEALIAGRDHERANKGHRWEMLAQHGKVAIRPSTCAALAEDPSRPDVVRVVNTCGACRIFRVARRNADGTVKSKEFTVKPKSQRRFLKRPESEIVIEGESDCPGS
jgi:hypothetical protein